MPILSRYGNAEKTKTRLSISDNDINQHIDGIFNLQILNRVRLVVLSGVDDVKVYGHAVERTQTICKKRGINVSDLPYFGSRVSNFTLDKALTDDCRKHLCHIIEEFHCEYHPPKI